MFAARGRARGALASRASVRARILTTVVALSAVGLLFAGTSAYLLQLRAVDKRVDAALQIELDEFADLARTGVDPATGKAFASARDLIYATMRLNIPARNEGILGIVGNDVRLTASEQVPLRPEADAELVKALDGSSSRSEASIKTVRTSQHTYRVLVIPVHVSEADGTVSTTSSGALVRAVALDSERKEFQHVFVTFAIVGLVALAVVTAVGWILAGRLLRPVRTLDDAARSIGETDLSLRIPVTGNDDLSHLTRTVNDMLERLERAFTSQRELLDDVGHELRTPITIVRGHLELMNAEDPDDARAAREIALSELTRMSRLVDDLMVLARSGRPDFIRPLPTDVASLLSDVLDTLAPLSDRDWKLEPAVEAEALLDPQRITQALLQLAANAVRFTEPGAGITIGARIDTSREPGDSLDFLVSDEGTGIPLEAQDQIFDRFERLEQSDEQERHDGAGLGLAIVSAIAQAHDGHASVKSAPGQGSTFIISIPLRVPRTATMLATTDDAPAENRPPNEQD